MARPPATTILVRPPSQSLLDALLWAGARAFGSDLLQILLAAFLLLFFHRDGEPGWALFMAVYGAFGISLSRYFLIQGNLSITANPPTRGKAKPICPPWAFITS